MAEGTVPTENLVAITPQTLDTTLASCHGQRDHNEDQNVHHVSGPLHHIYIENEILFIFYYYYYY